MNSVGEIARNLFSKADLNDDNILNKDEMRKIMKQMQINIDNKTFNQKFEAFDKDKNGVIDKKEFNNFIQTLMRKPELLPLFKKYASEYNGVDDAPVMTPQELVRFYKEEQKMEILEQEALEIIDKLKNGSVSSYANFEKIHRMSFYDFSALIFSNVNLIFNSEHVNVYQVAVSVLLFADYA
jgi:Ca2+-binding EF-hand superfamily protein